MNWSKLFKRNFDARTEERGTAYWRQGRVRTAAWKKQGNKGLVLKSSVRGSVEEYEQETFIDVGRQAIVGECTCPVAFNCKHVYAALLAATATDAQEQVDLGSADDAADSQPAENASLQNTDDRGLAPLRLSEPDPAPYVAALNAPKPAHRRSSPAMPLPYAIELWLTQITAAQANQGEVHAADVSERMLYVFEPTRDQADQGGFVNVCKGRVSKSGQYSGVSKYQNTQAYFTPPRYMLPNDIRILRQLSASTGRGYSFEFPMMGLDAELVQAIIATGRAFWLDAENAPLRWGDPRKGIIDWQTLEDGARQASLVTEPSAMALACKPPVYVDAERNECGLIESDLAPAVAVAVVGSPPMAAKWVDRVSQELQTRNLHLSIPLPAAMPEELLTNYQPTPVLTLKSHQTSRYDNRAWKHVVSRFETASLSFDYLGVRVSGKNPAEVTRVRNGRLQRVARDSAFERAARAKLVAVGLATAEKTVNRGLTREMQGTLMFADAVTEERAFTVWRDFLEIDVPKLRASGWRIQIPADFRFDLTPVADWYADIDESSKQWFDLEIGIDVEGQKVSLIPILVKLIQTSPAEWRPAAVEAMNDHAHVIVPLGDGRRAALPLARLKPLLTTLFELYMREPAGTRLRLSPLDAARLAEMDRALELRWHGGERMRALGERLGRFAGINPVDVPQNFHASLRPYQSEGLAWLQFLREYELAGVLADDMGLGKTVQTIAHLVVEKNAGRLGGANGPALVVAPTSMMATWQSETTRFAPDLNVMISHGVTRHENGENFADADLVLTTYALLGRDEEKLLAQKWHMVILDEAQNIKNSKTRAATIACQLQARHRLCLTGTPMENHLGEVWSLFRFLMPGLLGEEKAFKRDYRVPIEREGDTERQQFLSRRIRPFLLRRTKDLVAKELPDKTLVTRMVEFDSAQADMYESVRAAMDKRVREEIAAKGIAKSHIVVLDALLKLRQICCDPQLVKTESKAKTPPSAKREVLMEMLDELLAEGRSILLFSQFTSMLELIEIELKERKLDYVKLTGATRDRKKPVEQFQSGEVKLFLISLKAGGTGLTLTAADTVIHYDPWWNPAVENQATDRAHRIGQDKPVFVYKLIARDTLEERIVELQAKKGALAAGLLEGEASAASALSAEDLKALFERLVKKD